MSNTTPSNSSPVRVEIRHFVTLFLWAIGLVLLLKFFDAFRVIALGFLAASITAAALAPLKRYFRSPRWWSAFLAAILPMMLVILLLILTSWFLAEPIRQELAQWPQINQRIDDQLAYWSARLGLEQRLTLGGMLSQLGGYIGHGVLVTTTSVVTNVLLALVFIFFGSLYLLGEKPDRLLSPILAVLPPDRRPQFRAALADLEPRFRWWFLGTLIAMTVTGVATWIGYSLVGVEFAGPLALLAGLAEIVPTFGPLFAFLVALLIAAAKGGTSIVGIIIVYLVIQGIESYIVQPFVMRQAVHIPPVITLFTIILWSKVLGAPGLILAIPINLVLWAMVDHLLLRPRSGPETAATDE